MGGEYARRDLWEPDEARFAYVAREMCLDGHWAVPHRYGECYAHKPPLLFWLINLSANLTGGEVNRFSARLPSFAGALLCLWFASLIARRWYDEATAWRTVVVLATTFLFWHEGGMGRMDALLCGLELAALYLLFTNDASAALPRGQSRGGLRQGIPAPAFARLRRVGKAGTPTPDCSVAGHVGAGLVGVPPSGGLRPATLPLSPLWRPLAAYACMGLAILAKGPVGLLVPLGVYVTATWAGGGRLRPSGKHLLWGPLLALVFPAVWLVAAWVEGAPQAYFRELIFTQNVGRVVGKETFAKPRAFYFYLFQSPAGFLPWTLFLPAAFATFRLRPEARTVRRRLLAWGLFVLAFFTLATGKRNLYVLCAWPAASMLVAGAWNELSSLSRWWRLCTVAPVIALLAAVGLAGLGAPCMRDALPVSPAVFLPLGVVALASAVGLLLLYRRDGLSTRWFWTFAGALALQQICISTVILPALNPLKTLAAVVEDIRAAVPPQGRLLIFGRGTEIVPLYCDRLARCATDLDGLRREMQSMGKSVLICQEREWQELLKDALPGVRSVHSFSVGHKKLAWIAFDLRE